MKPERWQQLDELFHEAIGRPPADRAKFLDEACAGEPALRKHVEALLSAHEEAASFMEHPALDVEARSLANEQGESVLGQTIGHYKVIASLEVGGMGEVYLAQDTQLGRKVALKLLPSAFTKDKDRVRRFQQEARAASALNHPNIITVYEIGQTEERHFIVTEFIDGETLRQRIGKGLQYGEVLSVGMQVADALAAAHAKGIVHRDIKPENIILVRDSNLQQKESFVKVLDFGIAKLTEVDAAGSGGDATTKVLLNTHEGSVMGTASYMSPEQARGEKVDARTDIWSLGIVLYEMLMKEAPFGGDTAQDVIASILKEQPPAISVEIPDRFRWIVEKALRKNRDERYQTTRELFSDLRELQKHETELTLRDQHTAPTDFGSGGKSRVDTVGQRTTLTTDMAARTTSSAEYFLSEVKRHRIAAVIVLAALVIVVAGIAFAMYNFIGSQRQTHTNQNQTKQAGPTQTMKMVRLTSTGQAVHAAISPDGKYVVHVVDDGHQQSLRMRQVSTSSDVQISPPADVSYLGITFSPNGDYLYYNVWDKKNPFALYQMPVLGGAPRKLVSDIDTVVTFSPDGKQFAFLRGYPARGDLAVLVANADGTSERELVTRRLGVGNFGHPVWSPDGKVIAYPLEITGADGSYFALFEVRVADGSEKPISSKRWWEVGRMAWLRDGSGLMFVARESVASPSQIWYLSYPDGEVQRITNDLNDYDGLSLTADSAVLVTVQSERVSNIWIAPNDDAHRSSQITYGKFDGVEGISWAPDGKIVYTSGASGKLDLWMTDANGTGRKQLTANAGDNSHPSVSPDGRYIVFASDRTGFNHIWRIDIDGSNARQLTNGNGEFNPECSPTGQWVVYQGWLSGKTGLWKVPLEGGETVLLVDKATGGVAISPDGKWIATDYFEPAYPALKCAIYPFEGGEPHQILDIFNNTLRWTPDGRALAYIDLKSFPNINIQPLAGGPPKRLTDFTSDGVFSFAWSHDGKLLAMARGTVTHDVVLISEFKDQK